MTDNAATGGEPSSAYPDVDLWVRVRDAGKVYVIGNAHTSFGRIAGYAEAFQCGYVFSFDEVEDMSAGASAWLAGFLAGNEPDLDEYMGFREVWDLGDRDPDVLRWIEACRRFRQTGYMPPLPRRPAKLVPANPLLPRGRLWHPAGEQVWIWDGEGWSLEIPQPELADNSFLMASVCHDRGNHAEWIPIPPSHEVCCDCGRITEH